MIIFIGMISFVVAITMCGLIYMCKTKCEFQWCCTCKKNLAQVGVFVDYIFIRKSKTCQEKCEFQWCFTCKKSKSVEKEEENQIYGDYYYTDGRTRATEMEVKFQMSQNMLRIS